MFDNPCNFILPKLNNNCSLFIPLSYVLYQLIKTSLALFSAIFIYFIAPLFYTPNLDIYVNRWTVVNGGIDGIGKLYIFELAKLGIRKFILIDRNEVKLKQIKTEIEFKYKESCVEIIIFDFNNTIHSEQIDKLKNKLSQFNIGFALNNVGNEFPEYFNDQSQLFKFNALGTIQFISFILPLIERCGGGQFVLFSSIKYFSSIDLFFNYLTNKSLISFISKSINYKYPTISVQCLIPTFIETKKNFSLFVVNPEKFVKQAIGTIGLVQTTSGCFNHEIQLLFYNLFPLTLIKYLLINIYWNKQKRIIKLNENINSNVNSIKTKFENNSIISQRISKIPTLTTTISGGESIIRNRS